MVRSGAVALVAPLIVVLAVWRGKLLQTTSKTINGATSATSPGRPTYPCDRAATTTAYQGHDPAVAPTCLQRTPSARHARRQWQLL